MSFIMTLDPAPDKIMRKKLKKHDLNYLINFFMDLNQQNMYYPCNNKKKT